MKTLHLDLGLTFRLLKKSFSQWMDDNAMRLSAALSYYSVFSIAPLLLIAIGLVGLVARIGVLGFGPDQVQTVIEKQMAQMAGPQVAHSVVTLVQDASKAGGSMTITGLVLLLFGASTVFNELKGSLNTIWGMRAKANLGLKGMIQERLWSFGMVLVIGFLLLVSLMAGVVLSVVVSALHLPGFFAGFFGFVLPLFVETLLFALVFKVLPDAKIRWRCVWMGAVVTALLFELGKAGLAWYLGRPSTTASFGATGSLVVLILWVFYASCILFFGAEFTKVYAMQAKMAIEPSDLAEKVPTLNGSYVGAPASVPAEPSPLHPGAPVPALPMKESLAPILATTMVEPQVLRTMPLPPRPGRAVGLRPPQGWLATVREDPFAQIGVAVGVGWIIGAISRVVDHRAPALTASEHFAQGSRKTLDAGRSLLALGAAWAARHLTKEALRKYGKVAEKEATHWAHGVVEKLEEALH